MQSTEFMSITSGIFSLLFVLKEKAYGMSYKMIGLLKTEAATGQTLDQARTQVSQLHIGHLDVTQDGAQSQT